MATSLPDFPPFDTDSEPTSLGIQWKKWVQRLENLFIALDIKDKARQKALLLHYGGANLSDIYYTLATEDDKEYEQVKRKLDAHFEPKVNLTFETYNFRQLCQEQDEPIDKFVTRLREAANRCDFHNMDREIKDQIVQKCFSERLRRRALREDLSLSNMLSAARAMELADTQAKAMENSSVLKVRQQSMNAKGEKGYFKEETSCPGEKKDQANAGRKKCYTCGGLWPHKNGRKSCPAWGLECRSCGKKNHFAKMCKTTKRVKKLDNYRATPHITTGKCPADLLFQTRPYRVRLPELSTFCNDDEEVRERDAKKKLQAKQYADRKSYVRTSSVQVGDLVLVRNERKGKLEPAFDPRPYTVTEKKGSMITASQAHPSHVVTRNSSFFKLLTSRNPTGLQIDKTGVGTEQSKEFDLVESNEDNPEPRVRAEDNDNVDEQEDGLVNEHEGQEAGEPGRVRDHEFEGHQAEEDREEGPEGPVVGEFEHPVIVRHQRERRAPGWHEQYEMGEDY